MTGDIFSVEAQSDLDGIWDYSADIWGEDQADRYIRTITEGCRLLAIGRRASREVEGLRCRKASIGPHVVFFRQGDSELLIIRILHQSMDPDLHL